MRIDLEVNMNSKKISWNRFALRLLVGFFAGMLLCTVVARSADSLTVAKVSIGQPGRDKLYYSVSGMGTVTGREEKDTKILSGFTVDELFVKLGAKVKKGDSLFSYHLEELNEIYEEKKEEYRKAEIEYEKAVLNGNLGGGDYDETQAKLTVNRAEEDLKAAEEKLAKAQEEAVQAESKALESFEEDQKKEYEALKEELEAAENDYEKAREALERRKNALEEDTKNERRTVEDLEAKLGLKSQGDSKIEALLNAYESAVKNNSYETYQAIREQIFNLFYGGEAERKEAESAVDAAQKQYDRAKEDRSRAQERWRLVMEEEQQKLDGAAPEEQEAAKRAYDLQVLAKNEALAASDRSVEDAGNALTKLTKGRYELELLLANFQSYIYNSNSEEIQKTRAEIIKAVQSPSETSREEREELEKSLSRAKADLESAKKKWEESVESAEDSVKAKEKALKKVQDKLQAEEKKFDSDEALSGVRSAVEQAESEVASRKRTLEDAKFALEQLRDKEREAAGEEKIKDTVNELSLESLKMGLESRKEEMDRYKDLLDQDGIVTANTDGVVSRLTLKEGEKTADGDRLKISTQSFALEADISGEEAEFLKVGGEITVDGGTNLGKRQAEITEVSLSEDGETSHITAVLPDGAYTVGGKLPFKMTTQSEYYDTVIPAGALRQDDQGYYVLVMEERSSILGVENTAVRVAVDVLDRDSKNVAVSGALSASSVLIIGSNKAISEGDRVREYE